jgi:hypothetical protein
MRFLELITPYRKPEFSLLLSSRALRLGFYEKFHADVPCHGAKQNVRCVEGKQRNKEIELGKE